MEQLKTEEKKSKVVYLELLRVIACFFVIVNHTNSGIFLSRQPYMKTWWASLAYFFTSKTAVPIFLMISGALLLGHVDSYRKCLQRVVRIALDITVFSFLYYVWAMYGAEREINVIEFFKLIYQRNVTNSYWYLYLYFGILIMLPLFQRLAAGMGRKEYQYLILISVVFLGGMPIVIHYMEGAAYNAGFGEAFLAPLVGTFFLGYYLNHYVKLKRSYALISAGVFVATIFLQTYLTYREYLISPENYLFLDDRTYLTITASAAALFYLARYFGSIIKGKAFWNVMECLGGLSFGIYLCSDFFVELYLAFYDRIASSMNVFKAVLIYEMMVFLSGALITAILKRIPYIQRLV